MVTVESTAYAGWNDCLSLSNGVLEVVCTTEVGPRIVHVGLADEGNLCHLDEDAGTIPNDDEWHLFGGHRLWHAPERDGRTDQPDNDAVGVDRHGDVVTFTQPTEPATNVRKSLTVRLADDAPRATITHRLVNEGRWPIEIAPWAISVFETGGTALLPIEARGTGRTADRTVALWPYTEVDDDRLALDAGAVVVDGRTCEADPLKVGVEGRDGWAAYALDGQVLRKEFVRHDDAAYPDRGAAAQVFTDGSMLELETVGQLETVDPGQSTAHVEEWTLFDGVDASDPAAVLEAVRP